MKPAFREVRRPDMQPKREGDTRVIPESELYFDTMRSGGSGGQSVNTTDSAVRVRWSIDASPIYAAEEKARIKATYPSRINDEGELYVKIQTEKSQFQNKSQAIERLQELVDAALVVQTERVTKLPKDVARKQERVRLEEKRRAGRRRANRSGRWDD